MAEILPIKGIRYNTKSIESINDVVTPPYDVISPSAQQLLYDKHPYNIIRLELSKSYPADSETDNRYTRAADTFNNWQEKGILIQDQLPSIYMYQQEFISNGNTYFRTGFICGLKCDEYGPGKVLPHEETLPKAKKDRKLLLELCNANFSPIFGLYDDPEKVVQNSLATFCNNRQADHTVMDENQTVHRVWAINDNNIISLIQNHLANKTIYIADGHHRYETALAYGKEMNATGKQGYDRVLITLVNLHDEGLIVLPTHRMIKNLSVFDFEKLLANTEQYFDTKRISATKEAISNELALASNPSFVLYSGNKQAIVLTLKAHLDPVNLHKADKCREWKKLDVSLLQTLILEKQLAIGAKERASGDYLAFTRDADEAISQVDAGNYQLSILMRPTKVEQVTAVATAGDKMPQKSTYFYPKLLTGLVINPLGTK